MNSLLFQYIIIGLAVLFAGFYLFKTVKKNLSFKKFKSGKGGCDKDCGCS